MEEGEEQENPEEQKKDFGKWYDKNYKLLLLIPLILLVLSVGYLFYFQSQNGDIIHKDVTLTGGTTITVFDSGIDIEDLKTNLGSEFDDLVVRGISDLRSGKQKGVIVETKAEVAVIRDALENYLGYELVQENSSIEFTGSTLSEGFYKQLRFAIILAFVFMAVVVFLIFRTFVPSLAVILSAFADIVMTVAVVDLFGMDLSIAGVIAFLMLIGYSVDTDILLTTRLLKRHEGSVNSRIYDAFKTGTTMTLTSIAAVAVALFIIYSFSDTLRQIFTILLIGLGFDLVNTWFANAGILKWYVERRHA
ncbi:preprotein translocase subunit SecF [Candidatus Pacearchaeota archaeon]|nr:preprotein translocase subunit SecF [Candidatus Pacearchaeota archaeon]